jgi:hypothetical protein
MARTLARGGDDIYVVIIGDGEAIRVFMDLKLLCSLMHIDYIVVKRYIEDKGCWTGLNFSVWRGIMESGTAHRGYF